MKTIVYVDGFNLFYGALRHKPYRWLDLSRLCQLVLPRDNVVRLKYFTALVKDRPDTIGKSQRQRAYLRALRTLPDVEIVLGHFLEHPASLPLAHPVPGGPATVRVLKTEEKGSDVNIATHLLIDAYEHAMELAVVISNDSDLALPIERVQNRLGVEVGVLNPHRTDSLKLKDVAGFYRPLRAGPIKGSQFPDPLIDHRGRPIYKPRGW